MAVIIMTDEKVNEINGVDAVDGGALSGGSKPRATRSRKSGASRKLNKRVDELVAERDELKDLLLRKAAEFDNFRRRTENEYSNVIASASSAVISEFLPVLDDLQRSLEAARAGQDFAALYEGIELVEKNFRRILEQRGVVAIEAVGAGFDPEKHEALMQVDGTDHPSGTVVEEHLTGYEMDGKVLRHAQVLVSK